MRGWDITMGNLNSSTCAPVPGGGSGGLGSDGGGEGGWNFATKMKLGISIVMAVMILSTIAFHVTVKFNPHARAFVRTLVYRWQGREPSADGYFELPVTDFGNDLSVDDSNGSSSLFARDWLSSASERSSTREWESCLRDWRAADSKGCGTRS